MARTKRKTEEFEVKKDYIPDFLEALGELAELCAKENDFRATSFRRAIIALEGQIITGVEDIKLFKLAELKGVGRATLEMLTEFIETGKIQRLEEMREEEETEDAELNALIEVYAKQDEIKAKVKWDAFVEAHRPLRFDFVKKPPVQLLCRSIPSP